MAECAKQRPAHPIEWIANYLLENNLNYVPVPFGIKITNEQNSMTNLHNAQDEEKSKEDQSQFNTDTITDIKPLKDDKPVPYVDHYDWRMRNED